MEPQKGKIMKIFKMRSFDHSDQVLETVWLNRDIKDDRLKEVYGKGDRIFITGPETKLLDHLIKMVKNAKAMVCVSSFLLQKTGLTEALLAAAERGVNVYMLSASEKDMKKSEEEMDERDRKRIPEHKELLDSMAGHILVRTAPHFHAKFLLTDPKSGNYEGFLMSCNATEDAFKGNNIDIGIKLTKEEVNCVFSQFIKGFWYEANHELMVKGTLKEVGRPEFHSPIQKRSALPCTIGSDPEGKGNITTLKERMLEYIHGAKKSIFLSGWSIQKDTAILKALIARMKDSVEVTICTRPMGWNTEALIPLVQLGAKVLGHERFHAKMLICDGSKGILMTANITTKGLDTGFEAAVELSGNDLIDIVVLSNDLMEQCAWSLRSKIQLKDASDHIKLFKYGDPKGYPNNKNPWTMNAEVRKEVLRDLKEFEVDSVDEMQSFTPAFPELGSGELLVRLANYKWIVAPPMLPAKSEPVIEEVEKAVPLTPEEKKEMKMDDKTGEVPLVKIIKVKEPVIDPFKLYKKGNGRYIVINKWEDLPDAVTFAKKYKARIVIPE
jgi:cardiolipin synthase A/B